MSMLPERRVPDGRPSRDLVKAADAQRRTELEIFKYHLGARYTAEIDQIDTRALGDVLQYALDEEMALLDRGLERANGSRAKAELVARKVTMLSDINNRRISRRFGA
jgi:hypothetical protein